MKEVRILGWYGKDDERQIVGAAQVSDKPSGKGVDYWQSLISGVEEATWLTQLAVAVDNATNDDLLNALVLLINAHAREIAEV